MLSRRSFLPLAFLVIYAFSTISAQSDSPCFTCQFTKIVHFEVKNPGFVRINLTPELLRDCQSDLGDLRIIDRYGNEIPFLLDSGFSDSKDARISAVVLPAKVDMLEIKGLNKQPAEPIRESYGLTLPSIGNNEMSGWRLQLRIKEASFARRIRVYVGTNQENGYLLAQGTIFRTQDPDREKLLLDLPDFLGTQLLVFLEGEGDKALNPSFTLQKLEHLPSSQVLELPMKIIQQTELSGRTLLLVEPPAGVSAKRLAFKVGTAAYQRQIQVLNGAQTESDFIFRKPGSIIMEKTEIDLENPFPYDQPLQILIENEDAPPLSEIEITTRFNQPGLVFLATENFGSLLYGGGRVTRSKVDLEQWRKREGNRDPFSWWKQASERWQLATLSEPKANPDFDGKPAFVFAMEPGKHLKAAQWSTERPFQVQERQAGLLRFTLQPNDLQTSEPDLKDLRIIDEQSRQWSYVIQGQELTSLTWQLVSKKTVPEGTRYLFELPQGKASMRALLLTIDKPFFHRAATLSWPEFKDGQESWHQQELALDRQPGQWGDLRFECKTPPISKLQLLVKDGEDEPLHFAAVQSEALLPLLLAPLPPGNYRLMLGNPYAAAPSYELSHLANFMASLHAISPQMEELRPNPLFNRLQLGLNNPSLPQILLWLAIGIAIFILGAYSIHLARLPHPDAK